MKPCPSFTEWQAICRWTVTGARRFQLKRVLLVDTEPLWPNAATAFGRVAELAACNDFESARHQLLTAGPDFLVTNLRLGAYNGLHLVYLATLSDHGIRAIVYSRHADLSLIREAQGVGAFFESPRRLALTLPGYLIGELPPHDRRLPERYDRRRASRGGRRLADVALMA
jgi:hypothetical protein